MTKTNKGNKNALVTAKNAADLMIVELPENYPLVSDPHALDFSYTALEAYASNYWNMDMIEAEKNRLGGWPIFTPSHIKLQVIDSENSEYEQDDRPKLVLYFNETPTGLVLNKSRCQMLTQLCNGHTDPKVWALHPGLSLETGVHNKKAQIVITAAKNFYIEDSTVADANAKLGLG